MQRFRNLGLIETNSDHFLIIKENKLIDYLTEIAERLLSSAGRAIFLFNVVQYWTETSPSFLLGARHER